MQRAEAAHERRERIDRERRQRDEVERARVELPHRADRVEHERALPDHPPGRPLEGAAGVGDDHGPTDPIEQPHTELGLEPPDALRQRRLGDADRVGAGGEAAVVEDREDVLDVAQLHRTSRLRAAIHR